MSNRRRASALFDAVLIGLALVVIGVRLALPLAVLIFFGAYVPLIGATVTGALAVLVALASQGLAAALAVLAAISAVQQIEGNVFQPVVCGAVLGYVRERSGGSLSTTSSSR